MNLIAVDNLFQFVQVDNHYFAAVCHLTYLTPLSFS
ncbi:Uncharacterised protein [Vibrio cholerae]|nr:Uncharacterised protein [Vibrio cholerae]